MNAQTLKNMPGLIQLRKRLVSLHPSVVLLFLLSTAFLAVYIGTHLNPDGILYFSYIRSAFFDQDLLLVNEFNELNLLPLSRHLTATGLEGNPVAVGTSILMTPFYALAFLIDWLFGLAGIQLGDNGYHGIYSYVFPFGSLFYGYFTFLMILKLIKKCYDHEHAELTLLYIGVGTPFLFYMTVHYHVSHLCSAFSVTLFVYICEKFRNDPIRAEQYFPYFFAGAISGLAILVRTQNGLFWIIPFCFLLFRLWHSGDIRRIFLQGTCFLAGAALTVSPQLTVWKILHGRWIHAPEAANINFLDFHLLQTLTSSYHGLFFWSPILIISVTGLFILSLRQPARGAPLLIAVFLQLAVNASMRTWWEGASFGLRLFVNCTPLFCIGLSYVYTRINALWLRIAGGLFVFWTFLLYLNVLAGKIDLNRFYSAGKIIRLQFRQLTGWLHPEELTSRLKAFDSAGEAIVLAGGVAFVTLLINNINFFAFADKKRLQRICLFAMIFGSIGLSGLIFFMGQNSHQQKQYWEKDLRQIETGLNSYKVFYIDYSFYITHGDYLRAKGRVTEAIREYIKAIRIHPTPQLYYKVGQMLIAARRLKEARNVLRQGKALWPEDARIARLYKRLRPVSHPPK